MEKVSLRWSCTDYQRRPIRYGLACRRRQGQQRWEPRGPGYRSNKRHRAKEAAGIEGWNNYRRHCRA